MTPLSDSKRNAVFDEKGESCNFCGVTRQQHKDDCGRDLDLHHIIPERAGGEHTVENLLPVCRDCHQTLEHTQGKALARIAKKETSQQELERLRCERDQLKGRINLLEEKVRNLDEVSVDDLVDYIAIEGGPNVNKVSFDVISRVGGRKAEVHYDRESAIEAYDEWGDRMDRNWVRIPKSQMQEIVGLVIEGLKE